MPQPKPYKRTPRPPLRRMADVRTGRLPACSSLVGISRYDHLPLQPQWLVLVMKRIIAITAVRGGARPGHRPWQLRHRVRAYGPVLGWVTGAFACAQVLGHAKPRESFVDGFKPGDKSGPPPHQVGNTNSSTGTEGTAHLGLEAPGAGDHPLARTRIDRARTRTAFAHNFEITILNTF